MDVSVIVPTFNEASNIGELVRRIDAALRDLDFEIVFVDDSVDDTPEVIQAIASSAAAPIRLLHRDSPVGGLGGAVLAGLRTAVSDVCVVMDGDLQHPPEDLPVLFKRYLEGGADVVVASRYVAEGSANGLSGAVRSLVSRTSTALTKAMFPVRLRNCSDPMTGFFLVDRRALTIDDLRPRGFKILLEILARNQLRIAEVPFQFAERFAGDSKASIRQGLHFLGQLAALRFGKMTAFAAIGVVGAILNVGIVWTLSRSGVDYVWAAVAAAEITIVGNFILQERFVFRDMRHQASSTWSRFAKSFGFNNAEAVIRIPIMSWMVESWHISSALATAVTLVVAFVARFVFHSLVVYSPRKTVSSKPDDLISQLDREALAPGEL